MRAIKSLVAFMGVLIIIGLGVLGYGLMNQSGKLGKAQSGSTFGAEVISLPAGSSVADTYVVGHQLVLRVTGAGNDRYLVLDPASGKVTGSFQIQVEAPIK